MSTNIPAHHLFHKGANVTFYAVVIDNDSPFRTFFESTLDEAQRQKLLALFNMFDQEKGHLSNREKFKKLEDYRGKALWEFKSHQVRVAAFWERDYAIYLAHGFVKKQDKWPRGELQQLQNIYDRYLALQ